MSRLGKLPIILPAGVELKIQDSIIIVKGPKGELQQKPHKAIKVEVKDTQSGQQQVELSIADKKEKKASALWGLYRQLVNNMVLGVSEGFAKKLEINGVGYRASVAGDVLTLIVGYSHPVDYKLPAGISAKVEKNVITIEGIDKQMVGEVSSQIRKVRKPEPYKGKGIKYVDEVIRRKAGKTAGSTSS
ncbi:MAG: 50S ribosomal protein L6 [bacterium]|nr:50S ribosomal protein L6 [bacterium]